jgi:hypothetical protein
MILWYGTETLGLTTTLPLYSLLLRAHFWFHKYRVYSIVLVTSLRVHTNFIYLSYEILKLQ